MMKTLRLKLTTLLLFCGLIATAQYNLTGYWKDQAGNHYYLRQLDNTLYWFGEAKNGAWANAYKANISNNTQRALFSGVKPTINGEFYDLPKGGVAGHGPLSLEIVSGSEIRKRSGAFGSTVFRKSSKPRTLPSDRSGGFSNSPLDGIWKGNDNGKYYIRQIGNKVIWFGERTDGRSTSFSNVAFGSRTHNNISLDWVDVPKGNTMGRGNLRLTVNGNTITKNSGSGFGGSRWNKSNSLTIRKGLIDFALLGYSSKLSLSLNNYTTSGGSPRWYKANDAVVNLPREWGGRFNLVIPEITQEKRFRNYHYYINDIRSVPRKVKLELIQRGGLRNFTSRLASDTPVLKISIPLETEGTEIVGRCTSCPSSDKGAPDVHISKKNFQYPTIFVHIPLKVFRGKIIYDDVSTYFDADINAGGICKITRNLCDRITGYKSRIPEEIDKGFQDTFSNSENRRRFEESINALVPTEARGRLTDLKIVDGNIVVEYL